MKTIACSAILTFLTGAFLVAPAFAQDDAEKTVEKSMEKMSGPKIEAVEGIKDLGIIPKGDVVQVEFELKNTGTKTVEIHEVRPACGCTVAEFDKTIPVGGTGTIRVELDSTGLYGANSKTITVFTNDPDNAAMVLTIKSDVKPYLAALPGYARFNTVQGEREGTIAQTLWAEDGNDFEVTSVKTSLGFMSAAFHEAKEEERNEEAEGRQWIVELTMASNAPVGALSEYLVVTTNHPRQKTVKIPISGFVRPVMAVSPPKANFRTFAQDEGRRSNVLLRSFATEDIKVTGATSSVENVQVSLVPIQEGRRYRVNIEIPPGMPMGAFQGTITIKTESPKAPSIEFPIEGVVN